MVSLMLAPCPLQRRAQPLDLGVEFVTLALQPHVSLILLIHDGGGSQDVWQI